MVLVARIARLVTILGFVPVLVVGLVTGDNDLALALLVFVAPFFFLRGLFVLGSKSIRTELNREGVYWLGEQYLAPTVAGGIHALIFGAWVTFAAIWGIVAGV